MRDDRSDDPTLARRGADLLRGTLAKAAGTAAGFLGVAGTEAAAAEKGGPKQGRHDTKHPDDRNNGDGRKNPDQRDGDANRGGDRDEAGTERHQAGQNGSAGKGSGGDAEGGDGDRGGGRGDGAAGREQRSARQDVDGDDETNDLEGGSLADRIRADLEVAADRRRTAAEDFADRVRPSDTAEAEADDDDPVDITLDIADDGDVTADVALNVRGLDGPPDIDIDIPDLPGFGDEEDGNGAVARAGNTLAIADADGAAGGNNDFDFAS